MKKFLLLSLFISSLSFASSICVGDRMVANMDNGHYDARILELYRDGTALIRYDVDNTTQVVALSQLSSPIRQEGNFRLDERVVANMDNGHYDAKILKLYRDGTALIRYDVDDTTQVVALKQLSNPIECTHDCQN